MNFIPVHRYILVESPNKTEVEKEFTVLLPEDHKVKSENFTKVTVKRFQKPAPFPLLSGTSWF